MFQHGHLYLKIPNFELVCLTKVRINYGNAKVYDGAGPVHTVTAAVPLLISREFIIYL